MPTSPNAGTESLFTSAFCKHNEPQQECGCAKSIGGGGEANLGATITQNCSIHHWRHSLMMMMTTTSAASPSGAKTNNWIIHPNTNPFPPPPPSIEHQNIIHHHQMMVQQPFSNQMQYRMGEIPLLINDNELNCGSDNNGDSQPQHHTPNRQHNCDICNKVFGSKSALAKHRLIHSKDRKYVCKECNKSFKRQDHLNGHHLTHLMNKPFFCKVPGCYKSYCDSRSLKRHIESQHQHILAQVVYGNTSLRDYLPVIDSIFVNVAGSVQKVSFDADEVDQKRIINSLIKMTESAGQAKTVFTFEEPKPVQCTMCRKRFKNMAGLYGHMRLHGGYSNKIAGSLKKHSQKKAVDTEQPKTSEQESSMINCLLNLSVHADIEVDKEPDRNCKVHKSEPVSSEQPIVFTFAPESIRRQSASSKISQLRSPTWINTSNDTNVPPYTPPPILATRRKATGLYCNINNNNNAANNVTSSQSQNSSELDLPPLTDVYPHINVGEAFQAKIEDFIPHQFNVDDDSEDILLWDNLILEEKDMSEEAMDEYVNFSSSSLVAGPYHIELALYLLYACDGDMYRATLAMVNGSIDRSPKVLPIKNYVFPENCEWTETEIQAFAGLLTLHDKDFSSIAHKIVTKNVQQCVEFYYLFKQINRERKRKRTIRHQRKLKF
ncbi:hypothetical protein ACOME3_002033 [Neoechinorhynchus agilis]